MKYDILIVGSGLGGLVCADILSKEGLSVCVVEKNKQAGGCLQSYKKHGCSFDVGVHYLGGLDEGQILNKFFKYLNIYDDLSLKKLDTDCFDLINYKNDNYPIAQGFSNFIEKLHAKFPNEKTALEKYIEQLKKIQSSLSMFHEMKDDNYKFLFDNEFNTLGAYDFLNSITQNRDLVNVLSGNISLFAGKREKTSLYLYGLISYSYIESAYKVAGGSQQIADLLINEITKNGGRVLTNSEVVKFNSENDKLSSVLLANNEVVEAETFISSIHPSLTLAMVDNKNIRKSFINRIGSLENSVSAFTIDVVFKDNSFKNLNYNYYHYNLDDLWDSPLVNEANWPNAFMFHIPAEKTETTYAKNLTVLSFMPFDFVKKWENSSPENRSQEYEEYKEKMAQKLLRKVDSLYPGFINSIKKYNVSTPLTFRDFNGTVDGSLYGIMKDYQSPLSTFIHPRTKVPNLLLTGQNIAFHGVFGVIIGAILTCGELIGIKKIIKEINDV